jgi:hypothetical protein
LLPLVHTHIEIAFETGAKPAAGGIELVAANTEVGHNAINLGYFVQPAEPLQVPEVVLNKNDTVFIIGHILPGICILVENNDPPFGIKVFQNFQGMSATTKGTINIYPVGSNVQSVDHFMQ